jgi:hypothetical protein
MLCLASEECEVEAIPSIYRDVCLQSGELASNLSMTYELETLCPI